MKLFNIAISFNSSFRENQHDPVLQTSQTKRTTSKCHTAGTNSALNYSKIKTHQIQQYIKLNHCGCQMQNARERIQDAAHRGEGKEGMRRGQMRRKVKKRTHEYNLLLSSLWKFGCSLPIYYSILLFLFHFKNKCLVGNYKL